MARSGSRTARKLWARIWRPLAIVSGFVFVAAGLGIIGLFLWLAPDFPDRRDIWTAGRTPSLVFLDHTGAPLAQRGAIRGEHVPVGELPIDLVNAFLATEDRRFYQHWGIDPRGLGRAVLSNLRAGAFIEGGSTITQQVAKNLFLTAERSARRKLQEVILALWLEERLSKDEILTLYLNRIYFGAGTYGIDAAARTYFGKSARDVTLAEAAMLAGLPKAPSRFAPTSDLSLAQGRSRDVLRNMVEAGFKAEADIAEALAHPATARANEANLALQYALDYVEEEVRRRVGDAALTGDLVVTTTLDIGTQTEASETLRRIMLAEGAKAKASQAALVSFSPDGALRAMVGGLNYADSQFNRAAQARRQPGSAFKPIVYLTALEQGFQPLTRVRDEPVTVEGWSPENANRAYAGEITLVEAVARSLNTVAVTIAEEVGRSEVIKTARRLGLTGKLEPNPSLALGTSEVTLVDLTGAYVPFASGGLKAESHSILKIETPTGGILYERTPPSPERIIAKDTVGLLNYMLAQVLEEGTGRRADLGGRPAAAKTGTSQSWRDAWFIGYTADLITGVWVGNDNDSPMNRVSGGSLPARIWKDYMAAAHEGLPLAALEMKSPEPETLVVDSSDPYTSFLALLAREFAAVGGDGRYDIADEPRREAGGDKRGRGRSIWPWNW